MKTVEVEELVDARGTLLLAVPVKNQQPFTKARFEETYQEGGPVLAPYFRVYAVGVDPESAIRALGEKIGWGNIDNIRNIRNVSDPHEAVSTWYYKFSADGTSMKAGGYGFPGGVILDWWK